MSHEDHEPAGAQLPPQAFVFRGARAEGEERGRAGEESAPRRQAMP
jgi:hypothetical protein